MIQERWKKARALLWVLVTSLFIVTLLFLTGSITIPGLPPAQVDLSAYQPWIFAILILLTTKALLELLRPVFRAALRSHVRYEADIFAHFKTVSYVVWATAILLAISALAATGAGQYVGLSIGLVLAALVYVLGEPILCLVGWMVIVTLRLYKIGDRIEANNVRGYVVEITPFNTTLREFGGSPAGEIYTGRYVTVPNSQAVRGNVFNATKDTPFVWDQVTVTVPYQEGGKAAEALLLDAAESVAGPMMRENVGRIRNKYEFDDLREYVPEEPTVLWNVREGFADLTLIYFCPVFERARYHTRMVKAILDRAAERPDVRFGAAAPSGAPTPTMPVVR